MKFRFNPFDCQLSEISTKNLTNLYSVAEGWYVEYKSTLIEPKKLAKSLSSFANQYGGWLIIGVEEDAETKTAKSFTGVSEHDINILIQNLKNASKDLLNPEVYFEYRIFKGPIKDINLNSGKSIVVIRIPPGIETPYIHSDGRIYRRIADSSDPKPETDRSTLDRLWERTERAHARLKSFVTHRPLLSRAEDNSCYLHLTILSDPYEIKGDYFSGNFEDFADIMKENPIPFDNIFTRSGGFIARQTIGNDPYYRTLTWEFFFNCHSFITLPLTIYDEGNIRGLNKYQYGNRFFRYLNKEILNNSRILDLNILFEGLICISIRHRTLVKNAGVEGPFYVKAQLENVWRTVPYIDLTSFIDHIEKYGIPVVQDDDILTPTGMDLSSFINLPEESPDLDINSQGIVDAVNMIAPIFDALGIPREILQGKLLSQELSLIGRKYKDIHNLRIRSSPENE